MKRVTELSILLLLVLTGCQHLPSITSNENARGLALVLYAQQFAELTKNEREHQLNRTREAYQRHRTALTHACLGLALGQPHYPGYNADAARTHLQAALTDPTAHWSAGERAFLSLRLDQIQRRQTQHTETQQALRALTLEKQQLQNQIEEAKRKLQAITEIEQDIGRHTRNR